MKTKNFFIIYLLLALNLTSLATPFSKGAYYEVCFTPEQPCTQQIVNAIRESKRSIYIQAYSFTSRPIARALLEAQKRKVKIYIIFDKIQLKGSESLFKRFIFYKTPIWIDDQLSIAHNKVMILDEQMIITGSFNFTFAAQKKNAENVLLISDKNLAQAYLKNWKKRQALSKKWNP